MQLEIYPFIFRAPEPAYTIIQEPPDQYPEFLVAEIHLPKVVSIYSQSVCVLYMSGDFEVYHSTASPDKLWPSASVDIAETSHVIIIISLSG